MKYILILMIAITGTAQALDINSLANTLKETNISDYQNVLPSTESVDTENPGNYADETTQNSIFNSIKQNVTTIRCTEEVQYNQGGSSYLCNINHQTYNSQTSCATACTAPGSCLDIGICSPMYSDSCGGYNTVTNDYTCSSNNMLYGTSSECTTNCYTPSSALYKCSLTGTQYASETDCNNVCNTSTTAATICLTGTTYNTTTKQCEKTNTYTCSIGGTYATSSACTSACKNTVAATVNTTCSISNSLVNTFIWGTGGSDNGYTIQIMSCDANGAIVHVYFDVRPYDLNNDRYSWSVYVPYNGQHVNFGYPNWYMYFSGGQVYGHNLGYADWASGDYVTANTSYSCPSGYTLSGTSCIKSGTCTLSTCPSGTTSSGSLCVASPNYTCPTGQTLTGDTCLQNGTCVAVCPTGQTLVGTECREQGSCSPNCTSTSYKCSASGTEYESSALCNSYCNSYECDVNKATYSSQSSCVSQCLNVGNCLNTTETAREIVNNCPDLNKDNCAVVGRETSGYECRSINGIQRCEESWETELTYSCITTTAKIDELLEKIDTNYCEYENTCTAYETVDKSGGTTTCRVYIDQLNPKCNTYPVPSECITSDCGNLFSRCTMKEYVEATSINDLINTKDTYYCSQDGQCSTIQTSGTQGVNVGIYTFNCPGEELKYCTNYEKKLVCPDGTDHICNTAQVCVESTSISYDKMYTKSCLMERNSTTHEVYYNETNEYDNNEACIQTSRYEINDIIVSQSGYSDITGCTDNRCINVSLGKVGDDYWAGWCTVYEEDVELYVLETDMIERVIIDSAVWDDYIQVYINDVKVMNAPNNNFPPETAGSCELSTSWAINPDIDVTEHFKTTGQKRIKIRVSVAGKGEGYLNLKIYVKPKSTYKCFTDYASCEGQSECEQQNNAECINYLFDVDGVRKICTKKVEDFLCPETVNENKCLKTETKTSCSNGSYNIPDIKTETSDFSADFGDAMLAATMTNEIKHIFSGKDYRCESGMWYLFDKISLMDYVKQKVLTYALAYVGGAISSTMGEYMSSMVSDGMMCMQALMTAMMSSVVQTTTSGFTNVGDSSGGQSGTGWVSGETTNGSIIEAQISKRPDGSIYSIDIIGSTTLADGTVISNVQTIDPASMQNSNNCMTAAGMKALSSVGLNAAQAAKVMDFLQNSYVLIIIDLIKDQITNIKSCSTCTDEKCAVTYNQYKDYVNINNKLCHFVSSDCTWSINLGFADMCLRKGYRYCCYNSIFGRILTEGAYDQLGYSWGDYDSPNCTAMTFDDLGRIDISQIDMSEFLSELNIRSNMQISEEYLSDRMNYLYGGQ